MNPASNLVLIGPMGAGKSSLGRLLAPRFGLVLRDLDRMIEERCGVAIPTIFELEGEAGFRQRERGVLEEVCAGAGQLIATGGGAVLDPANRERLRRCGFVVWLKVGIELQLRRLGRDRSRPLLQVAEREQRLRQLAAEREPLYAETCDLVFEPGPVAARSAAAALARELERHWQRHPPAPAAVSA